MSAQGKERSVGYLKDMELPEDLRKGFDEAVLKKPYTRAERAEAEEDLKLSYFYGGLDVIFEETRQRKRIVASGTGEEEYMQELLDSRVYTDDPQWQNYGIINALPLSL